MMADEYEEYLDQLVVEVEGKVGAMPSCLRNPLQASPPSSPIANHGLVVHEGSSSDSGRCSSLSDEGSVERMNGDDGDYDTGELVAQDNNERRVKLKDRYSAFEKSLQVLRESMNELRNLDVDLARQLLSVNDSIEELKWINENYELYDSKDSLIINSKSLAHNDSRYDSREQLHKRWVSERRLLATSSTSLHTSSMTNLNMSKEFREFSTNLNKLNQNNNSNGFGSKGYHTDVGVLDDSSIVAEEFEYHPRSMSTSCTPDAASDPTFPIFKPLSRQRPASSAALVKMNGPATSTPKAENKKEEEMSVSGIMDSSSVDSSQVSRVRVGSYGSQVRWVYRQTSEEELFF